MKKLLTSLLLAVFSLNGYAQSTLYGDVNGDGNVNITDVSDLIDYMLNNGASLVVLENADVNADGHVNIADVSDLIDMLLNPQQPPEPIEDWVDLGLPSGTIWATRNVGANSPEDYGAYFAWGETAPKDYYDWSTYKWYQEGYYDANDNWHFGYMKYCTVSSYGLDGFVDNKTELDPSDDAACAHYPGGRMPSMEQFQELCNNCTLQWTQRNGVNGRLVTGPNGNTMFFPASGYRWDDYLDHVGSHGFYWSRTLRSNNPDYAFDFAFGSGYWSYWNLGNRINGRTVRAVRISYN